MPLIRYLTGFLDANRPEQIQPVFTQAPEKTYHLAAIVRGLRRREFTFDFAQLRVAIKHVINGRRVERGRLLCHAGNTPRRRQLAIAQIGMQLAAQQRKQTRLATAVGAHQADAPAGMHLQIGVDNQRAHTPRQREIFKLNHLRTVCLT